MNRNHYGARSIVALKVGGGVSPEALVASNGWVGVIAMGLTNCSDAIPNQGEGQKINVTNQRKEMIGNGLFQSSKISAKFVGI